MEAPSAFLASATSTLQIQNDILPVRFHGVLDSATDCATDSWRKLSNTDIPKFEQRNKQKEWDKIITKKITGELLEKASGPLDKARIRAATAPHSGDWLLAPPITAVGLRMTNETIRVATGLRLGTNLCEIHNCPCGKQVECRGTHGLSCRRSAGRISRHNAVNEVIWRAMRRAKIPSSKEPTGLLRNDGKRPDGVTLIPWKQGKCLAWDVTMPDTFAASHLPNTAVKQGAAADSSATSKIQKYANIVQTHFFTPVAKETTGVWNNQATEFITELGRRMTEVTGEVKETTYLFQQVSVAIQRGNMLCFTGSFITEDV